MVMLVPPGVGRRKRDATENFCYSNKAFLQVNVCSIYNLYYDIMSSLYYHGGNVTPDPRDTLLVEGHSAFRK